LTRKMLILQAAIIFHWQFHSVRAAWSAETYELRGGTEGNIKHPYAQAGRILPKIVEAKSGGKIKAKWFHTGQLGGGWKLLINCRAGTIQFATLSNGNTGTR